MLAFITEAITYICVNSSIARPVRAFLVSFNYDWLTELVSCGYCSSFWVSVIVNSIYLVYISAKFSLIKFIVIVIIVHRLSNIIHGSIDRYFDTRKDIRYNRE